MGDKNSRFFFRTDNIDNQDGGPIDVPEDLSWAVKPGQVIPVNRQGNVGSTSPSGIETSGADTGDQMDPKEEYAYNNAPDFTIKTPVIRGIIKQEVSQNAEGGTTIDVTFLVDNGTNNDYEWEIRITR